MVEFQKKNSLFGPNKYTLFNSGFYRQWRYEMQYTGSNQIFYTLTNHAINVMTKVDITVPNDSHVIEHCEYV